MLVGDQVVSAALITKGVGRHVLLVHGGVSLSLAQFFNSEAI